MIVTTKILEKDYDEPEAYENIESGWRRELIRKAIDTLPIESRIAIIMELDEIPVSERMEITGTCRQTVWNRLQKALRQLRHPTRVSILHGRNPKEREAQKLAESIMEKASVELAAMKRRKAEADRRRKKDLLLMKIEGIKQQIKNL